ncbi:MAG: hypothetical protein JST52_05380 [Bacteroidetes bacterium]|nr:hypothetical protein [Bacteroidota bacterium]MBS1739427.1 hypothetical protein [Bacteroidota bacterium]
MKFPKPRLSRRPTLFKRLDAQYRVVFINDDSLEEVATFRLTKGRLYIFFSTMFVLTVTITVFILLFTPLKYYIPGYANNANYHAVVRLKQNVDSLSDLVQAQQTYTTNLKNVVVGKFDGIKDTTLLDVDKANRDEMNSILPAPEIIKEQAIKSVKKEQAKKRR